MELSVLNAKRERIEITEENFNELLERNINAYTKVEEATLVELQKGEILEFAQVNMALVTPRVNALDPIYSNLESLRDYAELTYNNARDKEILRIIDEDKAKYSNDKTQAAKANSVTKDLRKRWRAVKEICTRIHRERQSLWGYQKRLEIASKNLQSEAYASR